MKKHYKQLVAILLVSLVGFSVAIKTGVDYAVHLLLLEEAQDVGMDWAHLIDARINTLIEKSADEGSAELLGSEEIETLREISLGVFSVGNIYQIDFINAACHCDVSFVRPEPSTGNSVGGHDAHSAHTEKPERITELRDSIEEHSEHSDHPEQHSTSETTDAATLSAENEHLNHVLGTSHTHAPMVNQSSDTAVQNEALVREILQSGKHNIMIVTEMSDEGNKVIGNVYHPVSRDGEVLYVLRVLADLTQTSAGYVKVFYLSIFSILLLLLLSFAYPAIKYVRSARLHRLLDARAHFLANHDVLTGISNRNAFQEQAPKRINQCHSAKHEGVLLIVDINGFKEINDFHGHQIGDEVLQKVAVLLQGFVSKDCIVARLGGDEFGILSCETSLRNYTKSGDMQLPTSVDLDMEGRYEKLRVSFSIGFARYPVHGTDLPELMRHADLALYAAKKDGKAGAREYDPCMSQIFKDRLNLFREFRNGLLASQIEPYYQPLISSKTGKVEGFEALARWNHPERGVLSASDFSDVLDDREICGLIGREMLAKITTDMGRWKAAGVDFGSVGLNVDSADLLRPGFMLDVISSLAKNELTPRNLAIEVTENTVFGANYNILLGKLKEFRDLGCYVALDDFGTGFSSITHLKELPYTALKIDKSFVHNIVSDHLDRSIVKSLANMSDSIGYQLVAEGVETREQLEIVTELGCHLVQGYYFSEALAAHEVPESINRLHEFNGFSTPAAPRLSNIA